MWCESGVYWTALDEGGGVGDGAEAVLTRLVGQRDLHRDIVELLTNPEVVLVAGGGGGMTRAELVRFCRLTRELERRPYGFNAIQLNEGCELNAVYMSLCAFHGRSSRSRYFAGVGVKGRFCLFTPPKIKP